jgi:hypothetical protein
MSIAILRFEIKKTFEVVCDRERARVLPLPVQTTAEGECTGRSCERLDEIDLRIEVVYLRHIQVEVVRDACVPEVVDEFSCTTGEERGFELPLINSGCPRKRSATSRAVSSKVSVFRVSASMKTLKAASRVSQRICFTIWKVVMPVACSGSGRIAQLAASNAHDNRRMILTVRPLVAYGYNIDFGRAVESKPRKQCGAVPPPATAWRCSPQARTPIFPLALM